MNMYSVFLENFGTIQCISDI